MNFPPKSIDNMPQEEAIIFLFPKYEPLISSGTKSLIHAIHATPERHPKRLERAITPTSTSSKILITFEAPIRLNGADRVRGGVRFQRDGTSLFTGFSEDRQLHSSSAGASTEFTNHVIHTYLDSPNTTSSVTYTVQHASAGTSITSRIYGNLSGGVSVLRLMEIAG